MTPEQRDIIERLADQFEAHASFSTRLMREQHGRTVAALRAALATPPTCGTCKWGNRVVGPWGDMLMCKNRDAPAYVSGHVSPDDGCIKGYAPTEPTR